MKQFSEFMTSRLVSGLLVVAPIYLAILLLLKASQSLAALVRPIAKLVPDWLPAERILSLLLVLFICFFVGLLIQTRTGQTTWERIDASLFKRIPGYELFRGLAQRLGGQAQDQAWKPALAEIEDALVPAFIIEELGDGRLTVFVPSVPTPFAGAVYILGPERVHPLNIPLSQAISAVSRWGSGSKKLIAAMEEK